MSTTNIEVPKWIVESYILAAREVVERVEEGEPGSVVVRGRVFDRDSAQFVRGFAAAMMVVSGQITMDEVPELTAINDRHHASI
jgi:hypothetical protein